MEAFASQLTALTAAGYKLAEAQAEQKGREPVYMSE